MMLGAKAPNSDACGLFRAPQRTALGVLFFIPLDIFKENLHNKGIQNRLDAWLAFFSCCEPEDILALISRYPDFKALYEHVYQICRNTENIMDIFSKELRELDKNTTLYMIDEMQETIDQQKQTLAEKDKALAEKDARIKELEALLRSGNDRQ